MIRINEIALSLDEDESQLKKKAAKILKINEKYIKKYIIIIEIIIPIFFNWYLLTYFFITNTLFKLSKSTAVSIYTYLLVLFCVFTISFTFPMFIFFG